MVIALDELKAHLRIETEDEDTHLLSLIAQAQATAENFTRVSFTDEAPESVRLVILLMASFYFENRDLPDRSIYSTIRIAFENLLYPYRDPQKMF